MARSRRKAVSPRVIVAILAMAATTWAAAGEYHHGTHLTCNQCHVMHGTKDANSYGGGNGVAHLLKGTVNNTCLGCHNGSSRDFVASGTVAAPNDTISGTWASKYKNSSGIFQSDWETVSSPLAHDLGAGHVTAVQGTWNTTTAHSDYAGMQCTDCHEAHGNENYRNIVEHPGGVGTAVLVREGTEVHTDPGASGWTGVMNTEAIAFDDPNNIANWCAGCHTNITTGNKHPQNVALTASGADGAHWDGGSGTGFENTGPIGDGTPGIPRVRFAQAGADYAECIDPADTNKVMCLSCHKAHGSKYDSAVLWPYYTDGAADRTSGCGQCHNSGA